MLNNISVGSLKKINMCIFNSKITAIIGKNGSGKSILAQMLATIKKPDKGDYIINKKLIDFNNPNINYNRLRFDIGLVMQDNESQFFEESVYEHMLYQLKIYNYKQTKKHMIDSLKMVDLDSNFLKRKISTLSDSERFKVLLATALCINPKTLILDDPTCFLDKSSKESLIKLLRLMKVRYKKTIVILSNDVDFVLRVSDYIYVLDDNKVLLHGNKYDVFSNDKLKSLNIPVPEIIDFSKKFSIKSKTPMVKRDNVNDLIKDVYYYVEKKNRGGK